MTHSTSNTVVSPRLVALLAALATGNSHAVDAFWQDVQECGTPLIEAIKDDATRQLVTFLWRAEEPIDNVVLISDLVSNRHWATSFDDSMLFRLGSTNLYHRSFALKRDARFTYHLSVNQPLPDPTNMAAYFAHWRADPLNPQVFGRKHDDTGSGVSIVELPDAPISPWTIPQSDVQTGNVQPHHLHSAILNNERRVWVYTPPNYTPSAQPYPLLVLFDGWSYIEEIPVPTILDNLIAAGKLPPMVAVLLGSPDRERDLALYAPLLDFLQDELEPWLHQHYHVTHDPMQRIVGGLSLGGLTALYVGLRQSEHFGKVLSQSGGVFWSPSDDPHPCWLARQFGLEAHVPLHIYLEVGLLEREQTMNNGPSQLQAHRLFHDVLRARRYPVTYHEYNGDHHVICWRHTFADGLCALVD